MAVRVVLLGVRRPLVLPRVAPLLGWRQHWLQRWREASRAYPQGWWGPGCLQYKEEQTVGRLMRP